MTQSKAPTPASSDRHQRRMLILWRTLKSRYGTRVQDERPPQELVEAMRALTDEQLQWGLDADFLRGASWPPSTPELYRMALGGYREHGMLEPDQAFRAATGRDWQHKGVFHAMRKIGTFDFRMMSVERARAAFVAAYAETLDDVRSGQAVEIPPSYNRHQIESQSRAPERTPEQAAEYHRLLQETRAFIRQQDDAQAAERRELDEAAARTQAEQENAATGENDSEEPE